MKRVGSVRQCCFNMDISFKIVQTSAERLRNPVSASGYDGAAKFLDIDSAKVCCFPGCVLNIVIESALKKV